MAYGWSNKIILFAGSEFAGTIDAAPNAVGDLLRAPAGMTSDVPDDQKLTAFAPVNKAFRDNDFAQDSATKALVYDGCVV